MKNIFLKKIVQFLQPVIKPNKGSDRFLIVSTTALGDTLWATPAIENLRSSFPHAHIAVLTSPIGMQVLQKNRHIDELICLKEPLLKYFIPLWQKLYQLRIDTVLLFHASQRLTLPLVSLIGAKKIIGTAGINKGLDALLTHPQPNAAQHEILRRCKIAEQVGAKTTTETLSFYLSDDELLAPRKPGPWIALHPGSKDSFKRWPKEKFIELGRTLKQLRPCEILITGTDAERPIMEQIANQIPGAKIDIPNRSLRSFAALLKQMDLLISNDTGPVHLASALNTSVVAIYSSTDPTVCGPHTALNARIVSKPPTCDPCIKRKCQSPFCFLQISVDDVLKVVSELFSGVHI